MKFKLQSASALLLFVMLSLNCSAQQNILFNNDWQFIISEANLNEGSSNANWQPATLPHTALVEAKVMDGQWQGICWYKKNFFA